MASGDNIAAHSSDAQDTTIQALFAAWRNGNSAEYQRLANACLPRLLGLTARFLQQPGHREAVCRDTLLLAWRNLPEQGSLSRPDPWLFGILGSRLYSQLLALYGTQRAMQRQVEALAADDGMETTSPTGPRPALLRGEALAGMATQVAPEPPTQRLLDELDALIEAEVAQRQAPLTPTGERVYPPLFDPSLRLRMFRSRAGFRIKEAFKRSMGRPLEDKLFQRWLEDKPGSAWLEEQGLPRRSVEAYAGNRLDLELDPTLLTRGLDFPASFPNRSQRRKISNFFLWPGPWDRPTHTLAETQRHRFIRDIWAHRLDLTASASYAQLVGELAEGKPIRWHHHGILLNSEARVHAYLERYRLYMEDMLCFGFKPSLGYDPMGIAIDSQGGIIKSNKGLHRLAMAQTIGLERVIVRVRALHRQWWERHKGSARGREAMDNAIAALPTTLSR